MRCDERVSYYCILDAMRRRELDIFTSNGSAKFTRTLAHGLACGCTALDIGGGEASTRFVLFFAAGDAQNTQNLTYSRVYCE